MGGERKGEEWGTLRWSDRNVVKGMAKLCAA